jgi:hypothetical protein
MPGARCTRGLVCKIVQRSAHEHTGSAETLRHSPRNGFTAYATLSPATNSSCHRRRRLLRPLNPVGSELATADLAPATGVRTTWFCRTRQPVFAKRLRRALTSFVLRALESLTRFNPPCDIKLRADALASTTSRPAFVTTRDAPLLGTGRRELNH